MLLQISFYALPQNIRGKIIDNKSDEPLSFATVAIMRSTDSTIVTGAISDEKGLFSIAASNDNLLARISLIGYESFITPVTNQNLGVIRLNPSTEMLSEVVVTANAKMFKLGNNGITADIQNTPLKDIGSLSDILGQMPFVSKTDNAFTVLGKGSPIFYINNRLVRDNNELQRIQSNEIKKVTVITNPSAEYDASVNAVIKVETFRPIGEGLSIDLWTYNRYNSEWYTMDRASFNYRKGKLDVFANFEYANMSFPKKRIWHTDIKMDEGVRSIVANRSDKDFWRFYTPKTGFNYVVNDKHSLGAQYEYFNTYDKEFDYLINTDVFFNKTAEDSVHTKTMGNDTNYSHYINAYYNGQLTDWLNVKLDLDYKTSKSNGSSDAINTLDNNNREKLRTQSTGSYDLYAGKITMQTPLWNGNLTYGGEGSFTQNIQATKIDENDGIPGIYPSTNNVKQDLFSGFISYSKSFGAFSGDLGLRYENANSKYYENEFLVGDQSRVHRRLFPTFRISYEYNKDLRMELAYRNTVSRPSYSSLRSSITYMGPYQYAAGNPLLQPSYTNSLTYTLMWKQFSLMGIYRNSSDFITEVSQLYMGNSILFKNMNIAEAQFFTIALNYNTAFGIWRPNYDLSIDKNYITYGDPGITYNKPIFKFNLRNGFSISGWNFGMDISGRTKGNRVDLFYNTRFSWGADVYINTSFFRNQLLVGIQGLDIFNTRNDNMSIDYNSLSTYWENKMYRRTLVFSMTYRFNVTPKRYKGSNATDEIWRL